MTAGSGDRVSEFNAFGQQLQRMRIVNLAFGRERGVQAVAQNGQTQGRHVHAKLVAFAGDGLQLVARQVTAHVQNINVRDGVGRAAYLVLQHEVAGFDDAALACHRQPQALAPRGNRFIGLPDLALAEQRVVGGSGFGLHREHHQAGGIAVDSVDGYQRVDAQLLLEPHQYGLSQVAARGHDRQEMRLVDHDQLLVLEHDDLVKRDARLIGHGAVIVEPLMALVGAVGCELHAVLIDHIALVHALVPDVPGDGFKALGQKIKCQGPAASGQADAAGPDAVAGGRHKMTGCLRHGRGPVTTSRRSDPLKHQIPNAMPEFDATVFELGQRAVVRLGRVACQR